MCIFDLIPFGMGWDLVGNMERASNLKTAVQSLILCRIEKRIKFMLSLCCAIPLIYRSNMIHLRSRADPWLRFILSHSNLHETHFIWKRII